MFMFSPPVTRGTARAVQVAPSQLGLRATGWPGAPVPGSVILNWPGLSCTAPTEGGVVMVASATLRLRPSVAALTTAGFVGSVLMSNTR